MEISYGSRSMQRLCSDEQVMMDAWGEAVAQKVMLRLTEIEAARSLADLRRLPQARCQAHPTARGRLSVALAGPHRLAFEADHEPLPTGGNGGLDWDHVTRVRVLEVLGPPTISSNEGEGNVEKAFRA